MDVHVPGKTLGRLWHGDAGFHLIRRYGAVLGKYGKYGKGGIEIHMLMCSKAEAEKRIRQIHAWCTKAPVDLAGTRSSEQYGVVIQKERIKLLFLYLIGSEGLLGYL